MSPPGRSTSAESCSPGTPSPRTSAPATEWLVYSKVSLWGNPATNAIRIPGQCLPGVHSYAQVHGRSWSAEAGTLERSAPAPCQPQSHLLPRRAKTLAAYGRRAEIFSRKRRTSESADAMACPTSSGAPDGVTTTAEPGNQIG